MRFLTPFNIGLAILVWVVLIFIVRLIYVALS